MENEDTNTIKIVDANINAVYVEIANLIVKMDLSKTAVFPIESMM